MERKPRIFIASASESLDVADALNVNLDYDAEVTVWKHGFMLSLNTIDSLVEMAETVDFSIFIFTPDDVANIRNEEMAVARDNVVFELGLFTGTLGKERCFIVKPRGKELHLPTDLLGLTPTDYDGDRSDGNLEAAVNPSCALIKKAVSRLGLISKDLTIERKSRRSINYNYELGDIEHRLLAKILESHTSDPDGVSVHRIFGELDDIPRAMLNVAVIKLERTGLVDKSIDHEQYDSYYIVHMSTDGINYVLDNEPSIMKASTANENPTKIKVTESPKIEDIPPF